MENKHYSLYDKYLVKKNIDRIRYYSNKELGISAVGACYHLDKETQLKSGSLLFFGIDDTNGKMDHKEAQSLYYDYGILDIKFSKSQFIYSANSDYSYSITDVSNHSTSKYTIKATENTDMTCNTLVLMTNSNNEHESNMILATNEGEYHIVDIKTHSTLNSIKAHDYGIWALYQYDNDIFITGSDDNTIKLWDIRTPRKSVSSNNKTHSAGINSILKLSFDSNIILTGSYEEKLSFIDIRKFTTAVNQFKCNHSTWDIRDIKHSDKNDIYLAMSCSHEGVNLYNLTPSLELTNLLSFPVKKNDEDYHGSIVYGIDVNPMYIEKDKKALDILTCSFYDNKIFHWSYSLDS